MATTSSSAERELRGLLGSDAVRPGDTREYLNDATESRAVQRPRRRRRAPRRRAWQVAAVLGWCYGHDVPLIPRGGGSGFAGGAVPSDGGVVLSLERLRAVRELAPELWRMHVEAGLPTADVARLARENGLYYPPDPGAAEQSQIGGNIATNAGGPHTFKYGVTGTWVTGLEVVLAPGELITIGGAIRKDAAGYDLRSLLIGSEGTLAIITAAWLKLIPAPEVQLPVVAFYPSLEAGAEALAAVLSSGVIPAALEFLDAGALGRGPGRLSRPGAGRAGLRPHRRGRRLADRGRAGSRRAHGSSVERAHRPARPHPARRDRRAVALAGRRFRAR